MSVRNVFVKDLGRSGLIFCFQPEKRHQFLTVSNLETHLESIFCLCSQRIGNLICALTLFFLTTLKRSKGAHGAVAAV